MFTAADIFNAIVGYYILVIAGSAAIGATRALRDPDPQATAVQSVTPPPVPAIAGSADGSAPTRTSRITGLAYSRTLRAFHRFGWATGVGAALGWLAGRDMYRWMQPRIAATVIQIRARRTAKDTQPAKDAPDVAAPATSAGAVTEPETPETASSPRTVPPANTPDGPASNATAPPSQAASYTPDGPVAAITDSRPTRRPELTAPGALPGPEDPLRPGRPWLVLVPPPQEYPPTMPAADITDLESLVNFTGQSATVAGMEAEDAASASASMVAGAEFAQDTARRVADETASLEAAVAVMAMLRVDTQSTAAYQALLEAGAVYRDQTVTFATQCHEAANTAGVMAQAAAHYHETAQTALDILSSHQMPHAEAAAATGHGGADGSFYGVTDTGPHALATDTTPALPTS